MTIISDNKFVTQENVIGDWFQAHQRLKITKEHTIKPKEEADLDNNAHCMIDTKLKAASCPTHPQVSQKRFFSILSTLFK